MEVRLGNVFSSAFAWHKKYSEQEEESLQDVQIDEEETDETEMNTYEIPEGQSNITREETSSSSHVDSHTQGYFPTKGKQQGRDSAIQQMVNVMKENSYLRQRRHEEKTTIRDMDETDTFFLSMAKMTNQLPSLEQAIIKLHLSQAVLKAQIALEEKQERPQSTVSVKISSSSFNSAYALPLSNVAVGTEYMGPKGNTPQDLLDISGIHMAINASHEMN